MKLHTIAATAAATLALLAAGPAYADDGHTTRRITLAPAQQGTTARQHVSNCWTGRPAPGWTRWRYTTVARAQSVDLTFNTGTGPAYIRLPGYRPGAIRTNGRTQWVDLPTGFTLTYGTAEVTASPSTAHHLTVTSTCIR